MKYSNNIIIAQLLIAGCLFFSVFAQEKTITVSGTIVDSASGEPIPQAMILMAAGTLDILSKITDINNLGDLKIDTVFSTANGSFSRDMKINQDAVILGYFIYKEKYQNKLKLAGILSAIVNLGTIKISKANLLMKDTITVNGTVVDSATGSGLNNCMIFMSGLATLDTVGNTAVSGANGEFSKQVVIIGNASNQTLVFIVYKEGYQSMGGQQSITARQINVGTIKVKRTNTGIITGYHFFSPRRKATSMNIYSLNGRLLYAGPMKPVDKIFPRQKVMVAAFKHTSASVEKKKMLIIK